MVLHDLVAQFALFARIWLFIPLHLIQSKRPGTAPATPIAPALLPPT
jgi:hypothetical protein